MANLIILGSANAIPDFDHENSHMVLEGETRTVLIDCPGTPIARLERAGIWCNSITDIILTHFHPDHVSGISTLLMGMWLLGRTKPLSIYGLPTTLERFEKLMELFDWDSWPEFFTIDFVPILDEEKFKIIDAQDFMIFTSPVKHIIPTIGLRVEFKHSNDILAYSCDTEPCDSVLRLAKDAHLLIYEATGDFYGHSSAAQAGQMASKANAKSLMLIHYDVKAPGELFIQEAKKYFKGEVTLAKDFARIEFR